MNKNFFFLLTIAIVLLTSSCSLSGPVLPTPTLVPTKFIAPLVTVTPVCISSQPTQADIDRALTFAGATFSAAEWKRSYTVTDNRVAVTWTNDSNGALVYLEAIIFPCGYEEPDINRYFSDENWKVIFQSYESFTSTAPMCRTDTGLRLYEFKAVSGGGDYDIRYWAQNDTANRVISLMFVIPIGNDAKLNEFASRLFPRLSTCSH